jgi:hypothetical protein
MIFTVGTITSPVIAGLDPAIHLLRKKALSKKTFCKEMDPRVKPAGDAGARRR